MKIKIAPLLAAAVALSAVLPAHAVQGGLPADNPWTQRRVLNIAHQGGEIEAASNTFYAFKTAVAKGAHSIDLDVHATADRELVVLHDVTVDRTTNGTGRVDQMTRQQIQALDAAHWFVPGVGTVRTGDRPASDYTYRGVATGQVAPPDGFTASDFTIPTLRDVLRTFPDTYVNIEIKRTTPDTTPYEAELAALLAEFGRDDDTIVVSFYDAAIEMFKVHAPSVSTATATGESAAFWASSQGPLPGAPNPRYHALQVPLTFNGFTVVTKDFIDRAHSNGLAVHVWTIDSRAEMERLLDLGVDGIFTNLPTLLAEVLAQRFPA
ncbi:MAG TPA: glycerophosphodiester phosphodiesterase [Actinomycetota bacterium]|nr:glycerophosphodiester phosphodiesterase [Actinomycetota bacterium]